MEIEEIKEWCKSENLETNSNGVFKYHSDNGKEMINLPLIIKAFLIDKNFNQQQKENEQLKYDLEAFKKMNGNCIYDKAKLKERVKELEEGLNGVIITDGVKSEWHNINDKNLGKLNQLLKNNIKD